MSKNAAIKKSAPKAEAKPKAPKVKIGDVARKAIIEGKDNDGVVAAVLDKFPDAKTSNASVNWYRSQLREEGVQVKSSRKPKAPTLVKTAAPKGKPGPKPKPGAKPAAKPSKGKPGPKPKSLNAVDGPKAPAPKAKLDDDGGFD